MNASAASSATSRPGLHPGIVVGAIAIVVFAAAGAASYLGMLPGQGTSASATAASKANPAQRVEVVPEAAVPPTQAAVAAAPIPEPVAPAGAPPSVPVRAQPEPPKPAPVQARQAPPKPAPERIQPVPRPPAPAHAQPAPARPSPATPSYASSAPASSPNAVPPAVAAAEPAPVATVCRDCGTISSITPIEKRGESSGAGAVLGGIVGGVLGHQVGSGRGKDVATVAGAIGGALLGNEVERNKETVTAWDVRVRLEDGTNQLVRFGSEPSWRVGDKVRIEKGQIVSARQP